MTHLEIQELLRRKLNELIAAHASLKSHVDSRNADVTSAFDQALASLTTKLNTAEANHAAAVNDAIDTLRVPAAEYAALTQEFDELVAELNSMLGVNTMTDAEIAAALGG